MVAEAVERHGGIDVLCANAGIFPDVKLADMTEAGHRRDLRHQRQGHDAVGQGRLPALEAAATAA